MALRELLLPWDAQPQEVAPVASQYADGLLSLIVGADLTDRRTGTWTTSGSVSRAAGRGGLAISTNGVDSWAYRDTSSVSVDACTVLAMLEPSSSPSLDRRAYSAASNANNDNYLAIGAGDSNAARARVLVVVNANAGTPATTSRTVFEAGVPHCIALRWVRGVGVQSFVDGFADAFSTNTQDSALPISRITVGALGRTGFAVPFDGRIYIGAAWARALSDGDCRDLTANPWQLFEPRRIFVPVSAGGSFSATGALSSDASTLSGTATHFTLHASSGALSSDASTIAGSANHIVVHPSSGALSSQDATLAGTALRYRQFSATGALDSASATIAGDAAHTTTGTFSAVGALSAQDGTIAGTATHLTLHTATGAIQASDSTITGTAARLGTHDATGSLSADLASITGTALHTGDGAEVVTLRTGGHAYLRNRFVEARKRLALQRILSYLTEEEPAEETKRIIRAVKAGKPIEDKKPPVVMAEVSAEKIADKLIPSRVADLAEIPDIDMQAVIKKAIRLAQERDDEDVLLLL